jgi:hypothetical protein
MSKFTLRATRFTIQRDDKPLYDESATHVEIRDDGAGEFLAIRQEGEHLGKGEVTFDNEEIRILFEAIETARKGLRGEPE